LSALKPEGAHKRLNRLKQHNLQDTPPDEAFGRITNISDGSDIPKAFQQQGSSSSPKRREQNRQGASGSPFDLQIDRNARRGSITFENVEGQRANFRIRIPCIQSVAFKS
tara:strand:+ start:340 stop:669 length:330 start_codon:yes stop_codon:yes gene_type:complete